MFTRTFALAAIAALTIATGAAHAGGHSSAITFGNGNTATRTVQRADGHVVDTTTGPNGATRTRTVDRTAGATTASVTGFDGATASRSTVRTGDGSTTTITGRRGRTGTIVTTH